MRSDRPRYSVKVIWSENEKGTIDLAIGTDMLGYSTQLFALSLLKSIDD